MTHARTVLLIALLLLVPGRGAGAEEDPPAVRLNRARDTELRQHDPAKALGLYLELLRTPELIAEVRGDALLGVARCHRALDRDAEAEEVLDEILNDVTLPVKTKESAERARNELRAARADVDPSAVRAADLHRLAEQRRARALELVDQARRARDEGRYEIARKVCLDALATDPDCEEAKLLLAHVEADLPDRADLLRTLLRFAHTTSGQAFRRLQGQVVRLEREGRQLFQARDYAGADASFRRAILLVDGGEFFTDLASERAQIAYWLRKTIEVASAQGIDLGPAPVIPDSASTATSWRRRFFDLLSELFMARPDEEDPLVLYDALPARIPVDAGEPGLATGPFPEGVSVEREGGDLTRALWAERWIRANIGLGWDDDGSRPASGSPRLLDRFGGFLVVQHGRGVHRKVSDLLDGFPETAAPVAVDVAVLATTTAGGTALAARLDAQATGRESGADVIVSNRLVEEAVGDVAHIAGVQVLGTARLTLTARPSATVKFTELADRHPAYVGLAPPALQLDLEESRYGLWLEFFAEDLARAPGARRAALGIRAATRVPLGTYVVPKSNAAGAWSRLARPMAEQERRTYRIVPHAGTLILQGLTNPFVETSATHPGLVLLFGVRPAATPGGRTPIPDPPRDPIHTNGTGDTQEREYDLGPLAAEVVDELVLQGWPQRPASIPVVPATQRQSRERYLSDSLGVAWSQIAQPGGASPVVVRGRAATARLTPAEHARLESAVARLRTQDTALYQVDVQSVEANEEDLAEWMRAGQVQSFTPGTYLLTTPSGVQTVMDRMQTMGRNSGLYAMQSRLLARATQRVAAKNLRTQTIVEDLRVWRHTDGVQRYIPVAGLAEEGLLVLVRPGLEAGGKRLVHVDARAARLESLESIRLPETEHPQARITVPRHHPVQQRQAVIPLGDSEAMLLTLPAPEGSGRVIVVLVQVRKVQ